MQVSKERGKNARESAQAFIQFLSTSSATGKKYADFDNCWKRKPKLDYLAIMDDVSKKHRKEEMKVSKEKGTDDHHD
eukprot:14986630-Ditylum_brightwellii.AAC.3